MSFVAMTSECADLIEDNFQFNIFYLGQIIL